MIYPASVRKFSLWFETFPSFVGKKSVFFPNLEKLCSFNSKECKSCSTLNPRLSLCAISIMFWPSLPPALRHNLRIGSVVSISTWWMMIVHRRNCERLCKGGLQFWLSFSAPLYETFPYKKIPYQGIYFCCRTSLCQDFILINSTRVNDWRGGWRLTLPAQSTAIIWLFETIMK